MTNLIVARGLSPDGGGGGDTYNHIFNGDFESALMGTDGWVMVHRTGNVKSRETADPITGEGSLKITITDDIGGQGVFQSISLVASNGDHPYAGQTWRLEWNYKGTDIPLILYLDYNDADDVDGLWAETATASVQPGSFEFEIPALATLVDVGFWTAWDGGNEGDYWLDDVTLIKIADAP